MEAARVEPAVSRTAGAVPLPVVRLARCSSERSRSSSRASVLDALAAASLEAEAEARDMLLLQAAAAEEAAAAARERASLESALVQHAQRRGQQAAAMAAQLQETQRRLTILSARCEVEQSVRSEAHQALSTMQLRLDSAEAELEDERLRRSSLVAALQAVKTCLLTSPPSSPDSSLQLGGGLAAVASATSGSSEHRAAEQQQLPLERSPYGGNGDGSTATTVAYTPAAQPPGELAAALAAAQSQARRLQEQLEQAVCERNAVLDRLASLEQQPQQGDALAVLGDGGGGGCLTWQPGSPSSPGGSSVGEALMPAVDVEALGSPPFSLTPAMEGLVNFGTEEATEAQSGAHLPPQEEPAGELAGTAACPPPALPLQQAAALAGQQRQLAALLRELDETVKRMGRATSEEGGAGSAASGSPTAAAEAAPPPPAATPPPAAFMRQQLGLLQGMAEDLSSQAAAATALVGRQAELLARERTARERAEAAAAAASEERRQGERQRQRLQHYLAELQDLCQLAVSEADSLRDMCQQLTAGGDAAPRMRVGELWGRLMEAEGRASAAMRQSSAAAASASSEASVGAQRVAEVWRAVEAAKRKQGEVERQTAQVGRALALLHSRSLRDRFSALAGRFSEVAGGGASPHATLAAATTPASVNAPSGGAGGGGRDGATPTSRLQPPGGRPPAAAPVIDLNAAFGTPVGKTNGRNDLHSMGAEGSASSAIFDASPSPASSFVQQPQASAALLELELSLAEAAAGGGSPGAARRDGGGRFDLARRFELLVSSVERRLGELEVSLGSCPKGPLLPPPLPDTAHVSEQQEQGQEQQGQPGAAAAASPPRPTPGALAPVGMAMAVAAAAAAAAAPACSTAATQTDDGPGWDAGAAMLRAADCGVQTEAPVPLVAHLCWLASIFFPRLLRLLCAYSASLALSPLARLAFNRWTALLSALGSSMAALALALAFAPLASWQRRRGLQRAGGRHL